MQDKPWSAAESSLSSSPLSSIQDIQTDRISLHLSDVLHLTSFKSHVPYLILLFPGMRQGELAENISNSKLSCRGVMEMIDAHRADKNWILQSGLLGDGNAVIHSPTNNIDDGNKNDNEGLNESLSKFVLLKPHTTCTLTSVSDMLDLQAGIPWLLVHHDGIRMGHLALTEDMPENRSETVESSRGTKNEKNINSCLNHGKSSFDLSIKFHANDSREPLNIKKLYKLSVDGGFNSNCEELQSVSLIIRIIVMENDRARLPCIDDQLEDTNMYTASQLCAHEAN